MFVYSAHSLSSFDNRTRVITPNGWRYGRAGGVFGHAAHFGAQCVCVCVAVVRERKKMGRGGRRQTVLIITDPPDQKKGEARLFLSFAPPPHIRETVCVALIPTCSLSPGPRNVKGGKEGMQQGHYQQSPPPLPPKRRYITTPPPPKGEGRGGFLFFFLCRYDGEGCTDVAAPLWRRDGHCSFLSSPLMFPCNACCIFLSSSSPLGRAVGGGEAVVVAAAAVAVAVAVVAAAAAAVAAA